MATVMEFRTPADEFPLGSVFENLPQVTVELERLIPHEGLIVPYFWVRGAEADDVEAAFDSHAGVVSVELIESADREYLMKAVWEPEYSGVLSALAEADVAVLSATGTNEGWRFEVRGDTHDAIGEFQTNCQEHDITFEITTLHELFPIQGVGYELTDIQREALVLAYERGYFDSPREAILAEIADELGISQQSLSSRLKRGHQQLLAATLVGQ